VWPTPTMPMTITWVRMVEKLLAAVNRDGLTRTPSSTPSKSTTNGTTVGYAWRKRWVRWRTVRRSSSKDATFAAAPVRTPSNSWGAGRPVASLIASSFVSGRLVFMDPPWVGTRRILFYFRGLSLERWGKSTPADLQRLLGGDRRNARNRLIRNELLTGVDACRLFTRLDI